MHGIYLKFGQYTNTVLWGTHYCFWAISLFMAKCTDFHTDCGSKYTGVKYRYSRDVQIVPFVLATQLKYL